MANVIFKMEDGSKHASFESNDVSETVLLKLVDGMFAIFGVQVPDLITEAVYLRPSVAGAVAQLRSIASSVPVQSLTLSPVENEADRVEQLRKKQEQEVQTAKSQVAPAEIYRLPESKAVHTETTGDVALSERLDPKSLPHSNSSSTNVNNLVDGFTYITEDYIQTLPETVPVWIKTGIKDGNPLRYKCRYGCPNCGMKSQHYIKQSLPFVNCHRCNQQMTVQLAVPGHSLAKDAFNNFFVAGTQRPIKVVSKDEFHQIQLSRVIPVGDEQCVAIG